MAFRLGVTANVLELSCFSICSINILFAFFLLAKFSLSFSVIFVWHAWKYTLCVLFKQFFCQFNTQD